MAAQMLASFSSILFDLMVWVGGGIPSETVDIRLGDVVMSKPFKRIWGRYPVSVRKDGRRGSF
jgi:hypothetical protein